MPPETVARARKLLLAGERSSNIIRRLGVSEGFLKRQQVALGLRKPRQLSESPRSKPEEPKEKPAFSEEILVHGERIDSCFATLENQLGYRLLAFATFERLCSADTAWLAQKMGFEGRAIGVRISAPTIDWGDTDKLDQKIHPGWIVHYCEQRWIVLRSKKVSLDWICLAAWI